MAKNIIELNGKQYDAVSGTFIGTTSHTAAKPARLVDDFVRSKPVKPTSPTVADPLSAAHLAKTRRTTASTQHIAAHRPQQPKTLMRHAVAKPALVASAKVKIAASVATDTSLVKPTNRFHKVSALTVNQSRLGRAQQVSRFGTIQRFNDTVFTNTPTPNIQTAYNPQATARPSAAATPSQPRHSQALFEKAMASAQSHKQTYTGMQGRGGRHGLGRRQVAVLAGAFAVIFVAGFLMYRSVPSMDLGIASAKAGLHASLPGYQPSGFSLGQFNYSPGSIVINYHSNSDDRKFSITERTSTWDSSTLLTNFVKVSASSYQTFQVAGRTVYQYGNNNVTWVDGGIWYVVNGDTGLSGNQLLKMADTI